MTFFDPVNAILKKYHEEHDMRNVPLKVDLLKPIFENMGYVDKIVWERFAFPSVHILAQIKTYEADKGLYHGVGNYARIQISEPINYCWTRFILCKEMYHCIIDKPEENRVFDVEGLLKLSDHFTNSFLSRIGDQGEPYPPFETELDAEVMALETLFPYELRKIYCDDYDNGNVTALQLALRYRIPVEYVDMSMKANYFSSVAMGRKQVKI